MNQMKRIFIVIMLLAYIFCTLKSCSGEEDTSQCQKHSIEVSDVSCFLTEEENEKFCNPYFDNPDLQKIFKKYYIGRLKEAYSCIEPYYDDAEEVTLDNYFDSINITIPEKETYSKGETIIFKKVPIKTYLTSNDIEIIKNGNTCLNHYMQTLNNLNNQTLNKTTCFNVDRFEENKNLMDCGFATFNIAYKNKNYQFFSCYEIADENAHTSFKQYYYNYYSLYLNNYGGLSETVKREFMRQVGQHLKDNNLQKRKLQNISDIDLTMTIEDRHGNIITFDKNGKIDNPTKLLYSNHYCLNIILFLLNLLLLL